MEVSLITGDYSNVGITYTLSLGEKDKNKFYTFILSCSRQNNTSIPYRLRLKYFLCNKIYQEMCDYDCYMLTDFRK
jgi:hypothetical protein